LDLSKISSLVNMRYHSELGKFQVGGISSGLDTQSIVSAILETESAPLQKLVERYKEYDLLQKAFDKVKVSIREFRDFVYTLKFQSNILKKGAVSSDESVLSAEATPVATTGIYRVRVMRLATPTTLVGQNTLVASPDPSKKFRELNYMYVPKESVVRIYDNEQGTYRDVQISLEDTISDIVNKLSSAFSGLGTNTSVSYDEASGKLIILSDKNFSIVDVSGNFTKVFQLDQATVSHENGAYSLSSGAPVNVLSLNKTLSQIASYSSASFTGGTVKINGVEIVVNENDTLKTVLDRISNSKAGVFALYDQATGRIMLVSKNTGPTAITLEDVSSTGLFALLGLENHTLQLGQKAHLRVSLDGVNWLDLFGDTNEVSYNGVLFELNRTTTEQVTVKVDWDREAILNKVKEFVEKWNSLMNFINEKLNEEKVKDKKEEEMSEEEKLKGVLKGNDLLEQIQRDLRKFITQRIEGEIKYLSDLGITTGSVGTGYQNMMKGLLTFDEEKFRRVLNENLERVWNFFGGERGFATRLDSYLWELVKFNGRIDQFVGISGRLGREKRVLAMQISDWIERLSRREKELWRKFSALEDVISRFQAQGMWISQALQRKQ